MLIDEFEVSTMRKALKDFTFSNGVTVPAGTYIEVPALSTHLDEVRRATRLNFFSLNHDLTPIQRNYDNARQFQGFRFADIREEEGEGTKHQTVSINAEFLTFGTGRHAWCV